MEISRIEKYDHRAIEKKWQRVWADLKLYTPDMNRAKKPFYNLMMFPYPSAEGLHIGNMYAFTGSDIYGRFQAMQGWDVFEPIGLDGFGIHSENFALKIGRHPMDHARITQEHFYSQLEQIGAMFDLTRTLETYNPDYYRWTQWLFLQLFKAGLAYRAKAEVNFCPSCKTVLADEQIIDGKCERCGNAVEKRALEQWFFRITAYAEKLLAHIPSLKWAEVVKTAQTNWIGKKEGVTIEYPVVDSEGNQIMLNNSPASTQRGEQLVTLSCFTTRPDTNFGATFVVIAPEHEFVATILDILNTDSSTRFSSQKKLLGPAIRLSSCAIFPASPRAIHKEVLRDIQAYIKEAKGKSEAERGAEGRKKTGVFTGLYCLNQLTNERMPLYISDFVLAGFGTGAVVGVPGHDKRDFAFAKAFGLPVKRVVVGGDGDRSEITREDQVLESSFAEATEDKGSRMVNSGFLDGLTPHEAMKKIIMYLEEKGWGKRASTYHLRDWLISRQRYWGPPIPMIYCERCAKAGKSWFTSQKDVIPAKAGIQNHTGIPLPTRRRDRDDNSQSWNAAGWFPVPEDQLPVLLPRIEDYKPSSDGVAPLSKHKEFFDTVCPCCGGHAVRETDVSDTFLDSSWYFLRYPSLKIENRQSKMGLEGRESNIDNKPDLSSAIYPQPLSSMIDHLSSPNIPFYSSITKRWLPVAMYTGGAEHSVLHLLYSRYITMVLHDLGYVDFDEPFANFFAHGLIVKDGAKMSKSKGNVVNPDEYIAKYGADAIRLYLMFLGPFSQGGDFRDSGMEGMKRWVDRVWRVIVQSVESDGRARSRCQSQTSSDNLVRLLHKTIAKVTDDMEKRRYNTAIASLMELVNAVMEEGGVLGRDELRSFLLLLAPFAPHMTEEAWNVLNGRETYNDPSHSVHRQSWPSYDPQLTADADRAVVIQVNGKVRGTVVLSLSDAENQEKAESAARAVEAVAKYLSTGVKKVVFVPGKLINFVV